MDKRERGVKHQAVELIEVARNRELWQTMIADVSGYGTSRERERETASKLNVSELPARAFRGVGDL